MYLALINIHAGHVLTPSEKDELVVAAAFMHVKREELNTSFLNQERLEYPWHCVTYLVTALFVLQAIK